MNSARTSRIALETIDLEASRSRIQSELEQSRRQLVNIINFLPEPTFAIDRSGTIIIWNQAMERMTGVGADEVIGKGNFEHSLHILGMRKPALLDLLAEPDESLAGHGYTSVITEPPHGEGGSDGPEISAGHRQCSG